MLNLKLGDWVRMALNFLAIVILAAGGGMLVFITFSPHRASEIASLFISYWDLWILVYVMAVAIGTFQMHRQK